MHTVLLHRKPQTGKRITIGKGQDKDSNNNSGGDSTDHNKEANMCHTLFQALDMLCLI